MNKTIKLKCTFCKNDFDKSLKEYNRQIKKNPGVRFFCGVSCTRFQLNQENPPKGNVQNLKADNKRDEYSPFRYFVLRAKQRNKKKQYGCNITVVYLKDLWDKQNGICPFTGLELILPLGTGKTFINSLPNNASLDRIDNSKGYIEGNVRFISYMANLGRQSFSDDQLINFCQAVSNKN